MLFLTILPINFMRTEEKNRLTMYQTTATFLAGLGLELQQVPLIKKQFGILTGLIADIVATEARQKQSTVVLTRDRETVKKEATAKGEVLRQQVLSISEDAEVCGNLKQPVSQVLVGDDSDFLAYLRVIEKAGEGLTAAEKTEVTYDTAAHTTLLTDLGELTDTQGAVRQVQIGTSTATAELDPLFERATTLLEQRLDRAVHGQGLLLPKLVEEYEKARRIMHTAAKKALVFKGEVAEVPVLVYDRRTVGVPAPTLQNRSRKGHTLLFYTADGPTDRPLPGEGLKLKNGAEAHLDSYARLGTADGPYLLVLQLEVTAAGQWRVRG
jgi:hypothetical protein